MYPRANKSPQSSLPNHQERLRLNKSLVLSHHPFWSSKSPKHFFSPFPRISRFQSATFSPSQIRHVLPGLQIWRLHTIHTAVGYRRLGRIWGRRKNDSKWPIKIKDKTSLFLHSNSGCVEQIPYSSEVDLGIIRDGVFWKFASCTNTNK